MSSSSSSKKKRARASHGAIDVGGKEREANDRCTVVWLRGHELRLFDNPVLTAAARRNKPVLLLYVHSPRDEGKWGLGGAQRVWRYHALKSLDADVRARYGNSVVCRSVSAGDAVAEQSGDGVATLRDVLVEVLRASASRTLYFARAYEPRMRRDELELSHWLRDEHGVRALSFNAHLLHEPWDTGYGASDKWDGGHFGSMLPFYRACKRTGEPAEPSDAPSQMPPLPLPEQRHQHALRHFIDHDAFGLYPRMPPSGDWSAGIHRAWPDISERAARRQLHHFLRHALPHYESRRSRADLHFVSRLSPYIAAGMLSVREVYHEARRRMGADPRCVSKTFLRRLFWRDLAYWTLHMFPHAIDEPIRPHYAGVRWNAAAAVEVATDDNVAGDGARTLLRAWQRGNTGYPIIDAGMRELWQTGWMQQNIRMATASFLVEYLNLDWVHGARWYHDTLVDIDVAINTMMWQNAGRSGLDQWNFVIHPVTSARTASDPNGDYVRRWLPQLRALPTRYIHQPWEAPPAVLRAASVRLGENYPRRVVRDLAPARRASADAVRAMQQRETSRAWHNTDGYDLVRVVLPAEGASRLQHVFTRREFRTPAPRAPAGAARGEAAEAEQNEQGRGDAHANAPPRPSPRAKRRKRS